MRAIRTLLEHSIDYAGLFPPAGLDMRAAVENYANYRGGGVAWALGRFVLPVSRLAEFAEAAAGYSRSQTADQPWQLAALAGPDLEVDLDAIADWNQRHRSARIDTLELSASSIASVESTMHLVPDHLQAYIEIPIERDPAPILAAIARAGARAKVRTGGITSDAFPGTPDLIRFLGACIRTPVAFKATAGLHHPLRAEYRLTYAPDSACGLMFGFLNLFLATAFLAAGMDEREGAEVLEERNPHAFRIQSESVRWRGHSLDLKDLKRVRQEAIISFGSCSFTEPLSELQALHLLEPRVQQA
jgi:hypothetical protein